MCYIHYPEVQASCPYYNHLLLLLATWHSIFLYTHTRKRTN